MHEIGTKEVRMRNGNSNLKENTHILTNILHKNRSIATWLCIEREKIPWNSHAFWTNSKFCGNVCLSDLCAFIEN